MFSFKPIVVFASFALVLGAYLSLADAGIIFGRQGGCGAGGCSVRPATVQVSTSHTPLKVQMYEAPDNSPMPTPVIVEATDLDLSPFEAEAEETYVAHTRPLPAVVGRGVVKATGTAGRGVIRGSVKAVRAPVRAARWVAEKRPVRRVFGRLRGCSN